MAEFGKKAVVPLAFGTVPIEQIGGKLVFYKLFKKGHCQFDDFLTQLAAEGTYTHEIDTLFVTLDQLAKCRPVRGNKYHALGSAYTHQAHGNSLRVRLHEVKTKQLRLYYLHLPPANEIVVLLGKKNTQAADISQFRNLVSQYLDFICASLS